MFNVQFPVLNDQEKAKTPGALTIEHCPMIV